MEGNEDCRAAPGAGDPRAVRVPGDRADLKAEGAPVGTDVGEGGAPAGGEAPKELHRCFEQLHGADLAEAERAAAELGADARATGACVVVVSACLLGERVRYDGGDKHEPALVAALLSDPGVRVLPLCPEMLAGMGCPRPKVSFAEDGRVIDEAGRDRTFELDRGAARAARLAALAGAVRAILKERSPSCGVNEVHGPRGLEPGRGKLAERLARRGIPIVSEADVLQRK